MISGFLPNDAALFEISVALAVPPRPLALSFCNERSQSRVDEEQVRREAADQIHVGKAQVFGMMNSNVATDEVDEVETDELHELDDQVDDETEKYEHDKTEIIEFTELDDEVDDELEQLQEDYEVNDELEYV